MTIHQMKLERQFPTGIDEWVCEICDRRLLLRIKPYKKMVVEPGDTGANHSMSGGQVKDIQYNMSPPEHYSCRSSLIDVEPIPDVFADFLGGIK